MIKLAIFDLDGTIVDSMPYWKNAAKDYLESINIKTDENLCEVFLSLSLPEGCKYLKDNYCSNKRVDEIANGINNIMHNHYLKDVKIKPNMIDILKYLKDNNIDMCIASSTDRYLIQECLLKQGLTEYFTYIKTSTEIGKSKQHPDIYLDCINHYNLNNDEAIIFEDLPYGIKAVKPLNIKTVGIYDETSKNHQKEMKIYSTYYFDNFENDNLEKIKEILSSK